MAAWGGAFGVFVIIVVTLAQVAGNSKRNKTKNKDQEKIDAKKDENKIENTFEVD